MIREQGPRENLEIVSLLEVSQQIEKLDRLLGVRKDLFAPGKPVVDLVQPTFDEIPGRSWHLASLPLTLPSNRRNRLTWHGCIKSSLRTVVRRSEERRAFEAE